MLRALIVSLSGALSCIIDRVDHPIIGKMLYLHFFTGLRSDIQGLADFAQCPGKHFLLSAP